MAKYIVTAREVVYYLREVEAENEEQVQKMVFDGELDFDFGDVSDSFDFEIVNINEEK